MLGTITYFGKMIPKPGFHFDPLQRLSYPYALHLMTDVPASTFRFVAVARDELLIAIFAIGVKHKLRARIV
jgi:hypothetical protein